jgi:hypothetical protein
MNKKITITLACLIVLTLGITLSSFVPVSEALSVLFRVEQVAWGTSTTTPTEVAPGDTNAPLTTDIRNLSNETLKAVFGTLQLGSTGPFTDYVTGGNNANATAVPLQAGDIFNQTGEIQPAGSFSFTFRLNVARNATWGYYPRNLIIDYLVKSTGGNWTKGTPQTLTITILIPNRAPTIDSFTPSAAALTVNVGDSLNFTAVCSDPDNDTLTYEWKLDNSLVSTSTEHLYAPVDNDIGTHTLALTVSDGHLTDTQTWTITVSAVATSNLVVSRNHITAGFENQINMTVKNNLWKGTVQASLTVPSPFIIRGNQSWTLTDLEPSRNMSIVTRIYVPTSAIGSTMNGALTLTYSDEHGQAHTDTFNVGLVVQGYIDIIVYDIIINPQPVSNGSEMTITATLLNRGNVIASYANASLQLNQVLELSQESTTYVGDIEQNSPVPFTVVAHVKSNVQNGTHPVLITVTFQDDQYRQHAFNVTANLNVATGTAAPSGQTGISDLNSFLNNGGWTIIIVVAVGVVLLILYVRRLSKLKQPIPTPQG